MHRRCANCLHYIQLTLLTALSISFISDLTESRDVAHHGSTGIEVGILTVTAMVVVVALLLLTAGIVRYYRR